MRGLSHVCVFFLIVDNTGAENHTDPSSCDPDTLVEYPRLNQCVGEYFSEACTTCLPGECETVATTDAESGDVCCSRCQNTYGCDHWMHKHGESKCYLMSGKRSGNGRGRCDSGVLSTPLPKCSGASFVRTCIKCETNVCDVIHDFATNSPDACCSACKGNAKCEFWTYNKKQSRCHLKNGDPIVREKGDCTSGILPIPRPTPSPMPPAPDGAKNVLFIVVDDLRPNIGAYGASQSFMHTPNMDKLAATGVLFQRAYVQYSFCAPSRNSFMTGRRPDSTKAWSFMDHFREHGIGNQWTTMPQFFRKRGYLTLGAGKLFHPGVPPSFDAADSWDFFTWSGSCTGTTNGWPVLEDNIKNVACIESTGGCDKRAMIEGDAEGHWCKLERSKLSSPLADDVTVNVTIANLRRAKTEQRHFFIAAGFHKPHLPFHFPVEDDIYPPAVEIKPPLYPMPPKHMPLCAWHEGNFDNTWDKPCNHTGEFRRAYYSSITYTDSNIGKVLDELDALGLASITAIALLGDHGWQLGEMNLWRKMTNFELGVRVPLIFRVPWAQRAGMKTSALVEAVDIYPTFVEVTGLGSVPATEHLEGTSLASTIADPPISGTGIKRYAFSQFAKSETYSRELCKRVLWNECTQCNRNDIQAMGLSVRSDSWRLTEWLAWNGSTWAPKWDELVGLELYNHTGDQADFDYATPKANVAHMPEYGAVVRELREALWNQFGTHDSYKVYVV